MPNRKGLSNEDIELILALRTNNLQPSDIVERLRKKGFAGTSQPVKKWVKVADLGLDQDQGNYYLSSLSPYSKTLADLPESFEIGYDIEYAKSEGHSLIVKILEEEDFEFRKEVVEADFGRHIGKCMQKTGLDAKVDVFYESEIVKISPDPMTRYEVLPRLLAFFDVYRAMLDKGKVKF